MLQSGNGCLSDGGGNGVLTRSHCPVKLYEKNGGMEVLRTDLTYETYPGG